MSEPTVFQTKTAEQRSCGASQRGRRPAPSHGARVVSTTGDYVKRHDVPTQHPRRTNPVRSTNQARPTNQARISKPVQQPIQQSTGSTKPNQQLTRTKAEMKIHKKLAQVCAGTHLQCSHILGRDDSHCRCAAPGDSLCCPRSRPWSSSRLTARLSRRIRPKLIMTCSAPNHHLVCVCLSSLAACTPRLSLVLGGQDSTEDTTLNRAFACWPSCIVL